MLRLLLLVTVIFFAAACGGSAANNSANLNGNATSAAAPAESPVKPTPKGTLTDETADTADFEGTAGITEKKYPNIKFAGVDESSSEANFAGLTFSEDQSGFLAGCLAGLMTKSNVVGIVGGMVSAATMALMMASSTA